MKFVITFYKNWMAKLILLILTVGFAIADEPVLKIKDKLYTLVP